MTIDNNKSYTNKDMVAIYDELLTVISSLTDKWNPSNEADPGVVLTKLMSILGDKLNYNIDKNILELFPATVTQNKNARQIFNLIGYKMKWYQSASSIIGLKLNSSPIDDVVVPAFTTLTSVNGTARYVTQKDVTLYKDVIGEYPIVDVPVIEGDLITLDRVDLTQLDRENKLHLSDLSISENSIDIRDYGAKVSDWIQVDDITSYPLGTKCYEFTVDDKETSCYLRFPSDINTLSSEITIRYTISSGEDGNIPANTLTRFGDHVVVSGTNVEAHIDIIQPNAINNGAYPEDINTAYKQSRHYINTFDTLITKEDYYNFIKRAKIGSEHIVSNVVVADRTDDLNNSLEMIILDGELERTAHWYSSSDTGTETNNKLTPFDIVLYLLRNGNTYKESFKLELADAIIFQLEQYLGNAKAINLNLRLPEAVNDETPLLFKAKYEVKGSLITNKKVTESEAEEIQQNVINGIQRTYSSLNVNFGERIDYGQLVENIQSFDSRIKHAVIDPVKYDIVKITRDNTEKELTDDDKIDLLAKMIARGNIQYYEFERDLLHKLNNVEEDYLDDIQSIQPLLDINLEQDKKYTIKSNEVVTLTAPRISESRVWSTATIQFEATESGKTIPADTLYKIEDDEKIIISYKNQQGEYDYEEIESGKLVKSSIEIKQDVDNEINHENRFTLYNKDTRTLNVGTRYYTNFVKKITPGDHIRLNFNETFAYFDSNNERIVCPPYSKIKNISETDITIGVYNNGTTIPNQIELSLDKKLELEIYSSIQATENYDIKLLTGSEISIKSDEYTSLDGKTIQLVDTQGKAKEYSITELEDDYEIISRLDMFSYANESIRLVEEIEIDENENEKVIKQHKVKVETDSETKVIEPSATVSHIAINKDVALIGGAPITYRTIATSSEGPINRGLDDIKIISFKEHKIETNEDDELIQNGTEVVGVKYFSTTNRFQVGNTYEEGATPASSKISLSYNFKEDEKYLLTIGFDLKRSTDPYTGTEVKIYTMTNDTPDTPLLRDINIGPGNKNNLNKTYILEIEGATNKNKVIIEIENQYHTLDIIVKQEIDKITGTNKYIQKEGFTSQVEERLERYSTLIGHDFNYGHKVNSLQRVDNALDSESWWDINHLYNKYVIPEYVYPEQGYDIVVNKYSIEE